MLCPLTKSHDHPSPRVRKGKPEKVLTDDPAFKHSRFGFVSDWILTNKSRNAYQDTEASESPA
ncbi:hypothetical protein PROAA_1880002 [Candidatus Propionivibrio aalborgensis]|uniref:Uncharacterized protein n=1 Tax=Candidatus Propionivibrio aalborgensis TaxID=1860101 RepID=A0A1A8XMM6_9RHOO|nr:hypothetical protein PROAA_1880002 [Candidatus Propionivibrio aalborgensis]